MNISKGQKQDISDIFDIISNCIKHMESQSIYQWNKFYPSADIIENDIESEHCYVLNDNGKCIAYVAINEEQSPGKGIAKKVLNFIEDMATKNNYSCIRLDAYSGNETALKLYDHFGYKKAGQVYFPWRDLPFYCYEKNI
ncbi:GNAT family N-acetyltransferase [Clostridium botulinum]|nr:GNAT family N-acetyltransferase [Clostridium botulinum]NFS96925.1 GNAT family N-acetyltransferase [Clostridium botulinum]